MLRTFALIASLSLTLATNAVGTKFLTENKDKEGVVSLPSGLQYKVLRAGDGKHHPKVNSPCECHYEGRDAKNYPGGEKFDSSYDRGSPATFAPNQVIKGWTEVCEAMLSTACPRDTPCDSIPFILRPR
jgi:FKBP-type peptidyl-prolyl cis-trans isomerase FklB